MQNNRQRVVDLFLNLLQPHPDKIDRRINKEEISEMKQHARQHNLLMLIYSQILKYKQIIYCFDDFDTFINEIKPVYLTNMAEVLRKEAHQKEILELFLKNGIPAVIMRGSKMAADIYHDRYCRVSADIDILVRMSDISTVDLMLSGAEYVRDNSLPIGFWLDRIHHAVYQHSTKKDIIEVHWNYGIPSYFKLSPSKLWEGIKIANDEESIISPEMIILQTLIHHFMHAFRELKLLVDVFWALHKYAEVVNWQGLLLMIKETGLIKTAGITFSQIQRLWPEFYLNSTPLQMVKDKLIEFSVHVPYYLRSYFYLDIGKRYEFQNAKDKIFMRLALDKRSTIIYSFVKTLFPMPQAIKRLYDDSRNWTLPLNYVKFIKWRLKAWVGK